MSLMRKRKLLAMSEEFVEDEVVSGKTSKALIDSCLLDDNTLAVYLYTSYNKKYRLLYSLFIELIDGKFEKASEYTTRDHSEDKWRTGTLENYIWRVMHLKYWHYGLQEKEKGELILPVSEDSLKAISNACGNEFESAWDAWIAIFHTQEEVKKHRLELGYQRDIEKFNLVNDKVPELPKPVEKWVRTDLMNGYLLYDYKSRKACCSSCQNTVNVTKEVKRKSKFCCPNCKRESVALPVNKYQIHEERTFVIAQKMEDGIVLRKFSATRYWSSARDKHYKTREVYLWELVRCFVKNDGSSEVYYYGNYKASGKQVWYKVDEDYNLRLESNCFYLDSFKYLEGTKFYYLVMQGKQRSIAWADFISYAPYQYFKAGAKYPVVETLAKNGKFGVLRAFVRYPKDFVVKNVPCDYRAFGIPKMFRNEIINDELADGFGNNIATIRQLYEKFGHINADIIRFIKNYDCNFDMACTLLGPTGNCLKGIRYINSLYVVDGPNAFRDYRDYIDMCRQLNIGMTKQVLYPQNFKAAHDEVTCILNERKNAAENAKFAKVREKLVKTFSSFADDKYVVRLPNSATEIQQEGLKLGHCVATYIPRVIKGETVILFVREKEKSDVPYYTLEVKPDDLRIVQCRTRHNASAPTEIMEFVNKYVRQVADKKKHKKSA